MNNLEISNSLDNQLEIQSAYFAWLNSFKEVIKLGKVHTYKDLVDGVKLVSLLNKIDKDIFEKSNLHSKPKSQKERFHNLKIVQEQIYAYYDLRLDKKIQKKYVNLETILECPSEIETMIQLILGIVVQCDQKQAYIEGILQLEENHQNILMGIIKGILSFVDI